MKYYPIKRDASSLFDTDFDLFFKPFYTVDNRGLMRTDIKETEDGYEFEIDMPGVDKKDIELTVQEGYLTVATVKEEESEDKDKAGNYIRRERRCGSYSRSYYVGEVDEEKISAAYDKGILSVNVPKKAPKEPEKRKIAVN